MREPGARAVVASPHGQGQEARAEKPRRGAGVQEGRSLQGCECLTNAVQRTRVSSRVGISGELE